MTAPQIWDGVLRRLGAEIPSFALEAWVRPIVARVDESGLQLLCPSTFHRERLRERFLAPIRACACAEAGHTIDVHLRVAEESSRVAREASDPEASSASPACAVVLGRSGPAAHAPAPVQRSLSHTFDTFVVGKSNEFAHAASRAVAEQPSKAYNPLFLYGGVGMGKTHLMHAIGHLIKKRNPAMRLSYVSAEKFTIEVINSLRFDRMISFRDRFHTVDVLLVDDIQFIAGKERTQEEFFHTFNALYEQQKQIVISSDCLPKDINSIEERLRSRFEWGLIADIQPPDLETKIAILQKKAENERFNLPDDVAEYIARAIKSNVRELEGALTRLMAYASLTGTVVSLATAQQVLRNIIASQEKRVTIDLIQKRVSEHFNLREQDLKVRSNTRAIAFPRQVAMYIVKQLTTASLPEIGRQFGGKHHTTVLHSINKIEELRRSDKELNRTITRLMDALQ